MLTFKEICFNLCKNYTDNALIILGPEGELQEIKEWSNGTSGLLSTKLSGSAADRIAFVCSKFGLSDGWEDMGAEWREAYLIDPGNVDLMEQIGIKFYEDGLSYYLKKDQA